VGNIKTILVRSIPAVIAVGMANAAYAEDAETEQEEGLQKIIITAQKHEQNITEVGMTMNVFDGDTIKDLGIVTAQDIAQFTPALTLSGGATGVPAYTMRGVGFADITSSSSSTVGLYFDEVSIPYTVMSKGALFDVQRVEVLKGPQGDLYGRNTTAGQINFISNKPTDEFEAAFTAGIGNFGAFDLEGFVSGSLSEATNGRLAFKTTQSSEGWQRSLTRPGDELGEKDIASVRTLFDIELSEDASVLLNIHYTRDQSDNVANTAYNGEVVGVGEFGSPYSPLEQYLLPTGAHFGETPPWYSIGDNRAADWANSWTNPVTGETHNLRPQRDNKLFGLSIKLEWDLGDVLLTSITSHDKFERSEITGQDGMHYIIDKSENNTDMKVFSQELRFSGDTDNMLWIAGVYYSSDESDEFYNYFMADSIYGDGSYNWGADTPFYWFPIRRLHTLYDTETDSKAVFGHIEYDISEQLGLTFGLRYTEEERKWSGCTYDAGDGGLSALWAGFLGASLPPGVCGTLDDVPTSPNFFGVVANINDAFHRLYSTTDVGKWMGKIGLDYTVSDDVLLYATLSNGFKSGGFNGSNSNTAQQLLPYGPEEITSLEGGLKATLLDNTMQLNASVFKYDYTDKQESHRIATPVGNIGGRTNIPESEVTGAELDIQWRPVDGLRIDFGAAWLDTEIIEWNPTISEGTDYWAGTVATEDASGRALPFVAEFSYNALVYYEWEVSDGFMMDVSFDVNYTDDMPNPVYVFESVEGYTVSNARIAIGDSEGDWRLMLWGKNITDEYYYTGAWGGVNGNYSRVNGMPRTFGLTLTYNF